MPISSIREVGKLSHCLRDLRKNPINILLWHFANKNLFAKRVLQESISLRFASCCTLHFHNYIELNKEEEKVCYVLFAWESAWHRGKGSGSELANLPCFIVFVAKSSTVLWMQMSKWDIQGRCMSTRYNPIGTNTHDKSTSMTRLHAIWTSELKSKKRKPTKYFLKILTTPNDIVYAHLLIKARNKVCIVQKRAIRPYRSC